MIRHVAVGVLVGLVACGGGSETFPFPDPGLIEEAYEAGPPDSAVADPGAPAPDKADAADGTAGDAADAEDLPAPLAPLRLTGVSPARGAASGGEWVVLSGDGFSSDLVVVFDQTASPSVIVLDPRTARVLTPPHPPATVRVSAIRPPDGAREELDAAFVYANPLTIERVEPGRISVWGGTPVTVSGSGFSQAPRVLVDGRRCPVVAVVDDSHLLAVTPEGERLGPVDLLVASEAGQAALLGALIYEDPGFHLSEDLGLSAVAPSHGPAAGGTPIEVAGAGFEPGVEVFVGGIPATGVQVVSGDRVRAVTPPGSPGPSSVRVRLGDAEALLPKAFVYEAPAALDAVAPDQGARTGGTLVSLYGSGFPEQVRVFFGDAEAGHVVVASATRITCRTPPGPEGPVDVTVWMPDGSRFTLPGAFTYFDPTGLYGGTWGGPVQGTLNVTVLDASMGGPLADAFVIVGNDPATPYQGYTGPDGVVTFSGPDLAGPLVVSASKECYNNSSVVAFDAQNVTLALQYVCPTPGGMPPGVAPGRISGRVLGLGKYIVPPPGNCWLLGTGSDGVSCRPCWSDADCADAGARCVPIGGYGTFCATLCLTQDDCIEDYVCVALTPGAATCIPEPGHKTALCKTTQPDIFTEAPDPGDGSEVNVDLEYSILVRPGDLAVVCLGGFRDAVTDEFKPYAMGVRRHLHVNPGDEIGGVDVLLNIPMDRTFRVFLDHPPSGPMGPDFNYVLLYYDFRSDGVFQDTWSVPFAFGDPQVTVEMQPRAFAGDLADATYTILAGAFSLSADNAPFSVVLRQQVDDLQDDTMIRLDGATPAVVRTGVRRDVFGIWGWSKDAFFAVGQGGMVLFWDGAGFSAQPVDGATGATLRAVAGAGPSFAVAVGDAAEVLRYDGVSWRREVVAAAGGRSLTGVACNAADDCYAVAYGFAMHWDGGQWSEVPGVPFEALNAVAATGHQQAVAVGSGGTILRLGPSGVQNEASGTTASLRAVASDPGSGTWAAGDDGVLLRRSGSSWSVVPSGTSEDLYAIAVRAGVAIAVGDAGTVVRADSTGAIPIAVPGYAPHLRAAFWASADSPAFAMGVSQLFLGPFLQVPRVVQPPDGGTLTAPFIEFTADPGLPASMHYLLVAIPGLFGDIPVWEFIARGDAFHVDLPDFESIEGTPGIPHGTPLKLTIIRSSIPNFSIDQFDFMDLSPFEQSAWSVEITSFTRP